jgi:ribosomal protein S18 acetylase RimI-like enzyme
MRRKPPRGRRNRRFRVWLGGSDWRKAVAVSGKGHTWSTIGLTVPDTCSVLSEIEFEKPSGLLQAVLPACRESHSATGAEQLMTYTLTMIDAGPQREQFLPLLLLADESLQQVRSYMNQGELYAFRDDVDGAAAGIVLVLPESNHAVELKAVAVAEAQQDRGIGKQMLRAVLDELRRRGCKRAVVGTANAAIGQLAYYQKAGFRLLRIERDFFSPARGYPEVMEEGGIRLRDMVWMDLVL